MILFPQVRTWNITMPLQLDKVSNIHLRTELGGMIAHLYGLAESEFAHILSTFPLVGEEVKSAAMVEFGKI